MITDYKVGSIYVRKETGLLRSLEFMKDMGDYMEIISPEDSEAREALKEVMNFENGYDSKAIYA